MSTPSRRLRMAQAAASTSPGAYEWTSTGATERVYWGNMDIGDFGVTTSITSTEMLPRAGVDAYSLCPQFDGPNNLKGARYPWYRSDSSSDRCAQMFLNVPSSFDLAAGDSFSIIYQTKSETTARGNASNIIVFDMSTWGATYRGVYHEVSGTRTRIWVVDDAGTVHSSFWNSGGVGWKDGIFYTWRWRFDRSSTKASISYKPEGGAWVDIAAGDIATSGSNFNTLGAISFSGSTYPNIGFIGDARTGASSALGWNGIMYQWAFAKNLTYLPSTLP